MGIEENKKLVLAFFQDINDGNTEGFMAALADDATWWVPGDLPISGTMGKADLLGALANLAPKLDGAMRLTPLALTAEGDRVAVEAESFVHVKNGTTYQNTYHFLFIVRDGMIHLGKEYMDTKHASETICR